jgi:hypothetical protein
MMRCTTDSKGNSSGWEKYWDPDATPMSAEEAARRHQRLLEILFGPLPGDS